MYNAMKKNLTQLIKTIVRLLPEGAPEFIYVSILRPQPLKALANTVLSAMIPETATVSDGSVIALNKKDAVVSGALMFGVYEKFETELIRKKLGPGMTVHRHRGEHRLLYGHSRQGRWSSRSRDCV